MAAARRGRGRGVPRSALVMIVFVGVGIWMLRWAYVHREECKAQAGGKTEAQGSVIRFERRGSTADGAMKLNLPVIQFATADGRTFEIMGTKESGAGAFYLNDKVDILYDPAAPAKAEISRWSEIWWRVILMFISGCVLVLVPPMAAIQYVVAWARKPN